MQLLQGAHKNKFHHRRTSHRLLSRLVMAGAILAAPAAAHACAACGCMVSGDWGALGAPSSHGFVAYLSYNYLNQNRQRYGTGAASADLINRQLLAGQEVETYTRTGTTTATLMYSDDTWGATVRVPWVSRTHGTDGNSVPLGSGFSTSADSGIGDVQVLGRYMGFSKNRSSGVIAGLKLPTGGTSANFTGGAAAGTPLDASLQIGTGSTDVILGGYLSGAVGNRGWFVQGTVQRAVATQNDYHPGDTISLTASVRYAAYGAKFSPMLQFNVINRQPDTGANATPADPVTGGAATGGTLVYLSPGAQWRVGGGVSVYGFVQIPVFEKVNSLQLTPGYVATVGVRRAF